MHFGIGILHVPSYLHKYCKVINAADFTRGALPMHYALIENDKSSISTRKKEKEKKFLFAFVRDTLIKEAL